MHVKTFIFDEKVLLTGSVNMTHNGFENDKEHLFRMIESSVVADVLEDFEKEWAGAEIVTPGHIEELIHNWDNRTERKKEQRENSVSRNPSSSRSFRKTKSQELDRVAEDSR